MLYYAKCLSVLWIRIWCMCINRHSQRLWRCVMPKGSEQREMQSVAAVTELNWPKRTPHYPACQQVQGWRQRHKTQDYYSSLQLITPTVCKYCACAILCTHQNKTTTTIYLYKWFVTNTFLYKSDKVGAANSNIRTKDFGCWSFALWQHLRWQQLVINVQSWWLNSAAPPGDQTSGTMTCYPTQSHYPDIELVQWLPYLISAECQAK